MGKADYVVPKVPVIMFLQEGESYSELELFLSQQSVKPNISKRNLRGQEAVLL